MVHFSKFAAVGLLAIVEYASAIPNPIAAAEDGLAVKPTTISNPTTSKPTPVPTPPPTTLSPTHTKGKPTTSTKKGKHTKTKKTKSSKTKATKTKTSPTTGPTTGPTSTPTGTAGSCNSIGNKQFVDAKGVTYTVACNTDYYGGDIAAAGYIEQFNDCFAVCDATPGCIAFSWLGGSDVDHSGPGTCYLKSSLSTGTANPGVDSAFVST